jgi:hypothetical protein
MRTAILIPGSWTPQAADQDLTGSTCNSCRSGSAVTQRRSAIAAPRSSGDLRFLAHLMQFPSFGIQRGHRGRVVVEDFLHDMLRDVLVNQDRPVGVPDLVRGRLERDTALLQCGMPDLRPLLLTQIGLVGVAGLLPPAPPALCAQPLAGVPARPLPAALAPALRPGV